MSLKDQLDSDLKDAMKSGDGIAKDVIRMLKTEIRNREVEKGAKGPLDDNAILSLIATFVKKRKEAAKLFEEGGRQELADKEKSEIEFLGNYLPEQLSEDEIRKVVQSAIEKTGATEMKQMGQVMKMVKDEVGQSAEGALVSKIVKETLSK